METIIGQKSNFLSYFKRVEILNIIKQKIIENESLIVEALNKDLKKCEFESVVTETNYVLKEIDFILKNLKKWVRPKRVKSPLIQFPSKSFIGAEPYGKVLIIGPWNYPFQLIISPMVGAIAAGNMATVKPSEISIHTTAIIEKILTDDCFKGVIEVVTGGVAETTKLLESKFDYIFYTGSTQVGKIVMEAAAKNLTPVTLELGGKSPCIVTKNADLKVAAKRIIWGKFLNAGQTCIAPDYLYVDASIKDSLVKQLSTEIKNFFGENPKTSPDFGRIINENHFDRLVKMMTNEEVVCGGDLDRTEKYISPTLLQVDSDHVSMEEEIFGPILPILSFENLSEVSNFINKGEKPLALYLFSSDESEQSFILNETSSGGVCLNDTIVHISNAYLPFGGVGASGIGAYHGRMSFDVFSHQKSVMKRYFMLDVPIKYPPFKGKLKTIRRLLKYLG